jgi:hypothetical protein
LGIVELLISMDSSVILQIQKEVVDQGLYLADIAAGKVIVEKLNARWQALRDRRAEALMEPTGGDGGGRDLMKELGEDIRTVEARLDGVTFSLPEYRGEAKKQIGLGVTNKISEPEPSVVGSFPLSLRWLMAYSV